MDIELFIPGAGLCIVSCNHGQKQPEVVPDIMAYLVLMKEAHNMWGESQWMVYDKEFKEKAGAQ